jgi:protein-S-isoprenylcysteine O-methyltransferase Ste14
VILTLTHWWIVGLWTVFLTYWAIAALFIKRGAERVSVRRGRVTRIAIFLVILGSVLLVRRSGELRALQWEELHSIPMALIGSTLATIGAILAFSARVTIGSNWGPPGLRKTNTELVTHGPYRFIRHPIYAGALLMMAGTAIALTPIWWIAAVVGGIYFVRSARAEETYMAGLFPDAYRAYRARTKMLVPYLF